MELKYHTTQHPARPPVEPWLLPPGWPYPLQILETADSTNEEAKRLLEIEGAPGRFALLAREQTRGKGQYGRSWSSPRDLGLYVTFVQAVETPFPPSTAFTISAGIAAATVVGRMSGLPVRLKPLNDLCVKEGKLGGVLIECVVSHGRLRHLLTGIGVNLRKGERRVEPGALPAVSLEDLGGFSLASQLDTLAMARELADAMDLHHGRVFDGRWSMLRDAWEALRLPDTPCPDWNRIFPPGDPKFMP